jgi:hypothetical protein
MILRKTNACLLSAAVALSAFTGPVYAGHTEVAGADGFTYTLRPGSGRLEDIDKAGLTDPVSDMYVSVDGTRVSGSSLERPGGEGLTVGQIIISGLTITQDMFVSSTQNLSRYLTKLENPTAGDITVDIALNLTYSSAATDLVESSSGDALLDVADTSHIVDYNTGGMHVVQVYGSAGAAEAIDTVAGADGSNSYTAQWSSVTIPAGQTRYLMHFIVGADDLATAQGLETAVSGLTGVALQDIEFSDLTSIINWSFVDTDSDLIPDIVEDGLGLDKNDPADAARDLDGDGLSNVDEIVTHRTRADVADTDGDGLSDGAEVNQHLTNPRLADTDGDVLTDREELRRGLDPLDPSDGPLEEVTSGVDADYEQHQPQVAVDSLGRRHLVWVEYNAVTTATETSQNGDVRYKLLDKDGQTLIDTTEITTNSASDQGHPSIAVGANNIAYLFWFDSNDTDDGHAFALDPSMHALDGSPATLASVKAFTDAAADADGVIDGITNMKRTSAQVDKSGRIHVAYTGDNSEVGYIVFDSTGAVTQAAFEPFSEDIDNDYAAGQLRMALDGNNRAHIVWSDGADELVHYGLVDGVAGSTLIDATALDPSGTDNQMHPSVSVSGNGVAYIVWGDLGGPRTLRYGKLNSAADDRNGDAADLATVGFNPVTVDLPDSANPWYMHSQRRSDGRIAVSYTSGGGNSLSPLHLVLLNAAGKVVEGPRELLASGADNYTSYGNYAFFDRSGNVMAFASDTDPKNIMLLDSTTVYPHAAAAVAKSSSGGLFGLWMLAGLGLLGALKRRVS